MLKKRVFYVYALCYPDGCPFYVGKGTGARIKVHEQLASKTIKHNDIKSKIIQSLWNGGEKVVKKILFRSHDEKETYRQEKLYIKVYSQLFDLCNKTHGGGQLSGIRRKHKIRNGIPVRFEFPVDIHDKLKLYRESLSLKMNRKITMNESIVHLIDNSDI